MSLPLSLVLMFLAASIGVAAGYSIWRDLRQHDSTRARRRMESEFHKPEAKPATRTSLFKSVSQFDLRELAPDGPPDLDAPLPEPEHPDWRTRLQTMLAQSGLPLSLPQLAYLSAAMALAGLVIGMFLGGPVSAGLGAIGLGLAPLLYIRHQQKARHDRFLKQLPDAFDLMARVLRSGNSVPQAFQSVADSFEPPISNEFAHCQEQQNLGLLPEVTYRELARRTGVLEIKIFVMAMLIQRQTGGNLSEVLERLAALVRERVRLRNHVRTLTAEGRMQALVLLVLPPIMFLVMRFVNRSYADVLLEHTGLLAAMAASMAVGALWIRKIIQFDF
ncbi:MAG TPA: type II secretion system F family protein [Gemmataceae bacterium]|nr:type II secretion system F family protein [Gemmataceae bacterium]